MLSYHNNQAVKDKHVEMAKRHLEKDMLVKGTYGGGRGKNFKACSVGCFAHDIKPKASNYHKVVSEDAGWPLWLVYLNDKIFEGLPQEESIKFHLELREAVPVGVDIEPVRHMLNIRRMDRLIALMQDNKSKSKDIVIESLNLVRATSEAELNKQVCDWSAVRETTLKNRRADAYAAADADADAYAAAYAAAAAAAAAAAYADADDAYAYAAAADAAADADAADADAYADAYADAADAAADAAAAYADAYAAARYKAYQAERNDLLEILRSLK